MFKFFDMDGGFFRFMGKVGDIILINFITLVCCLGVITIGPAITAMYYTCMKSVREEGDGVVKCYFRSFKQNFVQSVIISIILVALTLFFAYDIYVTFKWADGSYGLMYRLLFFAIAGITAVMALGGLYVFPMIAKFYNSTGKMIKNSVMMAVANLPQAILMAIISAAMILLIRINPYSLAFAIGISGYLKSMIVVKVFDKYIPKEEDEEAEEGSEEESEESEATADEDHIVITEADMNQGLAALMGNAYQDDEELMEAAADQEETTENSEE